MNIIIQPELDGLAGERLRTFAAQLTDHSLCEQTIRDLVNQEASWAKRTRLLNGQTHSYEAAARLLSDLRLLKWTIRADKNGILEIRIKK